MSEDDKIDAWLAGELSDEEASAVEASMEVGAPTELADEEFLDLESAPLTEEVDALIKQVRDSGKLVPPDAEEWREILLPSDDPNLLGTLGTAPCFEITSVIAVGGMSIVFKGRDPKLDRVVAIKALTPELAANRTTHKRFLREARVAAGLDHENILPIHGVHDDASVPFYAMKYIEGGTLQDALDGGPLPLEKQTSIAHQVASALTVAHVAGVIHRDIKPANILLDADDKKAWLCDFGIARSTEDPSLTYAGSVAGTPHYMSPEQAAGGKLDGRSDLFSLGAVLYRCATGEQAFSGNTSAAVLQQIQSTTVTPIVLGQTKLPKWYERLVANLLAKDPRDRPRDAAAVERAIDEEYSPRPKRTVRQRKRLALTAITIASLVAIMFGLLQLPGVRVAVNKTLAKRHEQAFFIDGKLGAHGSLATALQATSNWDTILLPSGDPIPIDKIEFPSDKALTLKPADPKRRPTLTTAIEGAPGLIATAPLYLEGIDFILNTERDGDGIIILRSTDATITDCTFTARRAADSKRDDIKARAIELHGVASVSVSSCDFDLDATNAISFFNPGATSPARATISSTQIKAYYGIDIHTTDAESPGAEIEMSDSNFSGEIFLRKSATGDVPLITCAITECEFDVNHTLCWLPTRNRRILREHFRWNGLNNQHKAGKAFVNVSPDTKFVATNYYPITNYSTPAALISNLFKKDEEGVIEIEQTGERFEDLGEALRSAPAGATVLLSGRIAPPEELLIRGSPLHIRAAPGARPTIVGTDHDLHALFLFGGGSIKGIRFLREGAVSGTMPVLGMKVNEAPFLIEDCLFESIPAEEEASNPLIITNATDTTVRRCVFINPEGSTLGLNFAKKGLAPMSVKLEDCLFTGRHSIEINSTVPNTNLELSAKRCVFIATDLVSLHSPLYTTRLSFTDCIIDCQDTIISFANTSAKTLRRNLTWEGQRNFYRDGANIVETPLKAKGVTQPAPLRTFEELAAATQRVSEVTPTFGVPFDRTKLNLPMSRAALLEILDQSIESSAVQTLKEPRAK